MKKQPRKRKKSGNSRALKREREVKERLRSAPTLPNDPLSKIERALDEYTRSGTVDYVGFSDWFDSWFPSTKGAVDVSMRHRGGIRVPSIYPYNAVYSVFKKYREQSEQELISDQSVLLKFQLLAGCIPERMQDAFESIRLRESGEVLELGDGLEECTQAELRFRLFAAQKTGQERVAFKLLGKLREGSHHDDELVYLEALTYFKFDAFKEAVKYADRIDVAAVDHVSAQKIILESLAFLGKDVDLMARLEGTSARPVSFFFRHYLFLVVISNSDDPVSALDHIISYGRLSGKPDKHDPATHIYNRYVCRLGSEYLDMLETKELSLDTPQDQATTTIVASRGMYDPKLVDSEEYISSLSPRERQVYLALSVDGLLLPSILSQDPASRHNAVISRLLDVVPDPTPEDFCQSLLAQYKHSSPGVFVENITSNLTALLSYPGEMKWDLLQLALDDALALGDSRAAMLTEACLTSAPMEQTSGIA
jgi:hypothetical protein